jgi:hypothetical protein
VAAGQNEPTHVKSPTLPIVFAKEYVRELISDEDLKTTGPASYIPPSALFKSERYFLTRSRALSTHAPALLLNRLCSLRRSLQQLEQGVGRT